jgi:hypothetical protein
MEGLARLVESEVLSISPGQPRQFTTLLDVLKGTQQHLLDNSSEGNVQGNGL